jgi:hypothetical protein
MKTFVKEMNGYQYAELNSDAKEVARAYYHRWWGTIEVEHFLQKWCMQLDKWGINCPRPGHTIACFDNQFVFDGRIYIEEILTCADMFFPGKSLTENEISYLKDSILFVDFEINSPELTDICNTEKIYYNSFPLLANNETLDADFERNMKKWIFSVYEKMRCEYNEICNKDDFFLSDWANSNEYWFHADGQVIDSSWEQKI